MKHLWLAWIASGIIGDAIVYIKWGKKSTLSYYVRKTLYLDEQSQRRRVGQILIITFLGWLGVHIIADCLEPLPYYVSGDYRRERLIEPLHIVPRFSERAGDGS